MNLCPCKRCRPPSQPLKLAIKLCIDQAAIARYGEDGYAERKQAERERLEKLHREKANAENRMD